MHRTSRNNGVAHWDCHGPGTEAVIELELITLRGCELNDSAQSGWPRTSANETTKGVPRVLPMVPTEIGVI